MIEPYNYNDEPSGRSETLVQALDRCERLEKQYDRAKWWLNEIVKKSPFYAYINGRKST